MNLTSKRILPVIAGCASLCVASAFAATSVFEDTFEDGTAGLPIGNYKQTTWQINENGELATNHVWVAADGDASTLVSSNYTYTGTLPITNTAASSLVLNLSTEGQTLTRNLGVTNDYVNNGPVYVDTMIRFTPSEDNPTISDAYVKAAVFVNASSNLCIYTGGNANLGYSQSHITDVGYFINPSQWYRLTILLKNYPETIDPVFQVYINGVAITNSAAANDSDTTYTWFNAAATANASTISSISFQGTGMIDDLVVTDLANGFGTPASVLLTLAFDSSVLTVTQNSTPVASNGTVSAGSDIAISVTKDWYELISVAGSTATYTPTDSNTLGVGHRVKSSTGTAAGTAADTLTITAAKYSTGTVSAGTVSGVDAAKLSTWALSKNVAESSLTGNAWYADYLMNVDMGTDAKLLIASITVDGSNANIVITTDKPTSVSHLSAINGRLKYYTANDLSSGFTFGGTVDVTSAGESVNVTIPLISSGKFFKARIEEVTVQ
jgi:hypothetical protein